MDPRFRKALRISVSVHAFLIALAIFYPMFSRLFRRRPPRPINVIDLTLVLPDIPAAMVQPATPQQPTPPPKDVPETPKPKPQVQRSTNRVVRPAPKPDQPRLTPEEIRRLLAAGAKISDTATVRPGEFADAWYYALVKQAMYEAWDQPSAAVVPPGTRATVTIRIARDGTVLERRLIGPSGNSLMDASVMRAVQSVKRLRPLPPQWTGPHRDVDVTFELADAFN